MRPIEHNSKMTVRVKKRPVLQVHAKRTFTLLYILAKSLAIKSNVTTRIPGKMPHRISFLSRYYFPLVRSLGVKMYTAPDLRREYGGSTRAYVFQKRSIQFLGDVTKGDNVTRSNLSLIFMLYLSGISELDRFPALREMREEPLNPSSAPVNMGGLKVSDCAQVNNWFDRNIKHAEKLRHIWMGGKFPILHAFTLLLDCPPDDQPLDQELFLVQKAWEIQTDGNCRVPTMAIDVDCEAIQALEEAMFTDSADAGKAG
ncbi:hypothetical protein C8J56DRAFT_880773 [Mycena floridula]|nr:hypothetical protein C8J56DRAFT_880773 [Mycena floridula]